MEWKYKVAENGILKQNLKVLQNWTVQYIESL